MLLYYLGELGISGFPAIAHQLDKIIFSHITYIPYQWSIPFQEWLVKPLSSCCTVKNRTFLTLASFSGDCDDRFYSLPSTLKVCIVRTRHR